MIKLLGQNIVLIHLRAIINSPQMVVIKGLKLYLKYCGISFNILVNMFKCSKASLEDK